MQLRLVFASGVLLTRFTFFQDLKYPKQVFFIVGNEFCERFSYYGMKGDDDAIFGSPENVA